MTKEEIEELKILEQLELVNARKRLIDFISYGSKEYQRMWYNEYICSKLDDLLSRKIKKLMVFLPPQHGKSRMSSIDFPAFALGRNPKEKIILGCYNKTKSTEFAVSSKRKIESEEFKRLFPEVKLEGSDRSDYWEVNKTGFYKAVGVDSGVTGTSGDIGIIDDPFKGRKEANSQTIRDSVWDWYQDDFLTRLHNDSIQLMLYTRWHEDDLAGRILDPNNEHYDEEEANEWTVIAIPALKEETKPIECAVDVPDPRKIDEALWPEKHSAQKYFKRRRTNPTGFRSLDQQRPKSEGGNKIREEWFEIIPESQLPFNPDSLTPNFWVDGAYTEKAENDPSAVLSEYFYKGKLYIMNAHGIRKELYEFLPYFKRYTLMNGYKNNSTVWVEPKASGLSMKSMLQKPEYGGFNVRTPPSKHVGMGKYNRVETVEPFIAGGKIVLVKGPWIKAFLDEVCAFPNGAHDDLVDVLCYAILEYFLRGKKARGGASYSF